MGFYRGNWKEPQTKIGKFYWYILFPTFIFSLIISALIESGIKLFGGEANLTLIWSFAFVLLFLILVMLNVKSNTLFFICFFILFLLMAGIVSSLLNFSSNGLNFVLGVIVAAVVCFLLAMVKDKFYHYD